MTGIIMIALHRVYRSTGFCAPYNGSVCARWLALTPLVFFDSSIPHPEQDAEARVMSIQKALPDSFSMECRERSLQLLCHRTFPDCDTSSGRPQPKPLCR